MHLVSDDKTDDETLMMSQFLDLLTKDATQNPSKLVPYTQAMSDCIDALLADVTIDEHQ